MTRDMLPSFSSLKQKLFLFRWKIMNYRNIKFKEAKGYTFRNMNKGKADKKKLFKGK